MVHLTFDDGPDPLYTPMLLDLLKEHGAKGTFFVVGERAKKYPELILRLKEEGHTIGIHNINIQAIGLLTHFHFKLS